MSSAAGTASGQLPGVQVPEYRPKTTLKPPTPTEFTSGLFNPYTYVVDKVREQTSKECRPTNWLN